jgi:hypothetical protein
LLKLAALLLPWLLAFLSRSAARWPPLVSLPLLPYTSLLRAIGNAGEVYFFGRIDAKNKNLFSCG